MSAASWPAEVGGSPVPLIMASSKAAVGNFVVLGPGLKDAIAGKPSIFRIEGRGVPGLRTGRRGDLIAVLQIIVPSKLDDEQRELLERYAETEDIETGAP